MAANEPQSALELWKEKLADYQRQLAIAADPAVKFQLEKQIGECQRRIQQLAVAFIEDETSTSKLPARNQRERQQAKSQSKLGKVVSEAHKYDGQLVLIELRFFDDSGVCKTKQIGIGLDIAFGEVEEVVKYKDGLVFGKFREGHIRFGLKHGKLCLALQNGEMPLNQRELHEDSQGDWQVRTTGIKEAPTWEFEARGQPAVLGGSRSDEKLGIVDLSDTDCRVEATFQANINGNDLEITAQDGAWENNATPQAIATKRRVFFKRVVEPKLKEYLSRVVLQYDSAIIP